MKIEEKLKKLRELVGGWAYRALLKGRPLMCWRRSTPHNWFIETARGGDYLWHSMDDEEDREIPDLTLFVEVQNSEARVISYWGSDSGMPELTAYKLNMGLLK